MEGIVLRAVGTDDGKRMPTRSDQRAFPPENGNRLYPPIRKLEGTVPCGASTSTQPDLEVNGGASNNGQQDDVVWESDAEAFTSRQQDDVAMEMDAEASTSRPHDVVMEMDAEASISRPHNDGGGEIEEETPPNADQGREEPKTKEDRHERDEWVRSIEAKVQDHRRSEAAETETISILRVTKGPKGLGQGVEEAFEPRVIPIGLLHRDKPHLQNMQKCKWQCLKDIGYPHLNDLFRKLKKEENRARIFYGESKNQLEWGDFLEMLLLDACFLVDYLCRASSDESKTKSWSDDYIRNDLLLFENQLPFFVVEYIYGLVKHKHGNRSLVEIAVKLFHIISPKDPATGVHQPEKRNFQHLLHLYHAYLFFDEHDDWKERRRSQVRTIPRAISLEEAGVKFETRKMKDKVINVRFKDGVMKITPLVIDDFTVSRFQNLIQFELANPNMEPRFTGFLQFMDCIINTSEDVALLQKNGILVHALGSDEKVAGIFNGLTSGTFHQLPWELKNVYEKADSHCKAKWNHWRATLLRDYFGSPWAVIAFVTAVLLVSFDSIQTFFSAFTYFRPPPSAS